MAFQDNCRHGAVLSSIDDVTYCVSVAATRGYPGGVTSAVYLSPSTHFVVPDAFSRLVCASQQDDDATTMRRRWGSGGSLNPSAQETGLTEYACAKSSGTRRRKLHRDQSEQIKREMMSYDWRLLKSRGRGRQRERKLLVNKVS